MVINNYSNVPEELVWPPKPSVVVDRVEHDTLLTSFVCAPETMRPMSRKRLHSILGRATDLERRYCWLIIDDYCKRYGIFPETVGIYKWLPVVPVLLPLGVFVTWCLYELVQATGAEGGDSDGHLLKARHTDNTAVIQLVVMFSTLLVSALIAFATYRRQREEAEDARASVEQVLRHVGKRAADHA